MSKFEPINLDTDEYAVREIPVTYGGKEYVLREAMGDIDRRVRNSLAATIKVGPEGKPVGIIAPADVEAELVAGCLFSKDDKGNLVGVSIQTVRSWPGRVVKHLYRQARLLCGYDKEESEALKKMEEQERAKALRDQELAEAKN